MKREEIVKLSWFKRQIRDAFMTGALYAYRGGLGYAGLESDFDNYFKATYKKEEENESSTDNA